MSTSPKYQSRVARKRDKKSWKVFKENEKQLWPFSLCFLSSRLRMMKMRNDKAQEFPFQFSTIFVSCFAPYLWIRPLHNWPSIYSKLGEKSLGQIFTVCLSCRPFVVQVVDLNGKNFSRVLAQPFPCDLRCSGPMFKNKNNFFASSLNMKNLFYHLKHTDMERTTTDWKATHFSGS